MEKKRYRKAIFVVVYRKESKNLLYVLLKRKLHWKGWEFPKGGVEKGESIKKCVAREVKEETGNKAFSIKKYNKSGKYKYHKKLKDRPRSIGQSYVLYSAEVKNKKLKFDKKEHSSAKWLDYKKALKKLTWPNQRTCLKIVNKNLKV